MKKKITLIIDAIINFVLGILLILFPLVYKFLGVPESNTNFYPNILGAVLIGIAIALFIEAFRKGKSNYIGLGLIGALSINMCGGIALALWLIFGELTIPLRGQIFLWSLAFILLILSSVELIFNVRNAGKVT
jgi:hypothetical protein